MAPTADRLEGALRNAVEEVYRSDDQNNLTVRFIRDKVENELGLGDGFFMTPEWKDKSKLIIKSWAAKLIDDDEAQTGESATIEIQPKLETKPSPIKRSDSPVKKGIIRGPRETKTLPRKRQKKEETPEGEISEVPSLGSVISDFKDSEDSDPPKVKRKDKAKPRARVKAPSRKRTKVESDESEIDNISDPSIIDSDEDSDARHKSTKKEPGKRRRLSKSKVKSDDESEEEHVGIKTSPAKPKTERALSTKLESEDEKLTIEFGYVDSDSEAAMMIDGDSKLKRKKKFKSEASSSSRAPKPKAAPKDLSPDEAQIKTLQAQLTKCGVRKIWGIVLKKFGDDNKQKIRFLQGMLKDVGMTGRFSDQRAKEIKELRELQADLEAVQQGDSMWGTQPGRRARGQRKSFKEYSDESNDEDGNNGGGGFGETDRNKNVKVEGVKTEDKAAKVKQELAFLGDEESDSD